MAVWLGCLLLGSMHDRKMVMDLSSDVLALGRFYSFPQFQFTGQMKTEIKMISGYLCKHYMWLHMCRSQDNLWELVFYQVGPVDQA